MIVLFIVTWIAAFTSLVDGDCYMHNPRGSNNRLNEKSATRKNTNRVFDSQNNARGGYNVGDLTDKAAGNNASKQHQMQYITSTLDGKGQSIMGIEWTNQHGCGGGANINPNKLNCNLVIQMMCEDSASELKEKDQMRDGTSTDTNGYTAPDESNDKKENFTTFETRKNNANKVDRGLQEPYEWYDKCNQRERNKGLFTADQKLKGHSSKYTRQNPGGTQRGYECPEERDYFPYWHPTPWKDIKVLAESEARCKFYKEESFNHKPKHECVEKWSDDNSSQPLKHYSKYNNEKDCTAKKHNWTQFDNYLEILPQYANKSSCENAKISASLFWGRPMGYRQKMCLVRLPALQCEEAPFSRVNHLGNSVELEPLHIKWTIPAFPSGKTQKCILRIRYNISTDDYNPQKTFSDQNGKEKSPVTNNPTVNIGAAGQGLKLAVNTAQFGRTFQDRSHVSKLVNKDSIFEPSTQQTLHTIQVRGKRGNIVQTFPAVEYDFFPTNLNMSETDLLYFTWTGSNTHNNGPPGGDGQTGDAGQGTGGTDRTNVCGLGDRSLNFLLPVEHTNNICQNIKKLVWSAYSNDTNVDTAKNNDKRMDACIQLMSGGYYKCLTDHRSECKDHSVVSKEKMSNLLNNAAATFKGIIVQLKPGQYNYTCSRNNNFTNRSQKATIIVRSN